MTEIVNTSYEIGYITAEVAADMLGVTRATLYAYVSRHGIRTVAVTGSKQRLYWRDDVLLARRPKGRPRNGQAIELPESSISLIAPGQLFYRGKDAIRLSETATLEEAAAILWNGDLEGLFTTRLPVIPEMATQIASIMRPATSAERCVAMLPLIEAANPRAFDLSPSGMKVSGVDVLRSVTGIVLGMNQPSAEPIHEQIAKSLDLTIELQDIVRRLLVLSADLGFEPTACAVRSAASLGVSPYRCVVSGLLLLGARQTRLGRTEGVAGFLDELLLDDPERLIVSRLREGQALPGFGPGVYIDGDPRSTALLEAMSGLSCHQDQLRKLSRAVEIILDATGTHPTFALIAHYVGRCIKLDARESLISLGRCVGWIAHANEQYQSRISQRPPSLYVGSLPAAQSDQPLPATL